MTASPPEGGSTPVRQLIVVVLPAPFGPSRQNTSPSPTANHGPFTAWNG